MGMPVSKIFIDRARRYNKAMENKDETIEVKPRMVNEAGSNTPLTPTMHNITT